MRIDVDLPPRQVEADCAAGLVRAARLRGPRDADRAREAVGAVVAVPARVLRLWRTVRYIGRPFYGV